MSTHSSQDLIPELSRLLEEVQARAGATFSGIGIIVRTPACRLPVVPLRPSSTLSEAQPTAVALARISTFQNEYHDGFHVLTPDLRIELVSQYFSPPIKYDAIVDRRKRFGGRYLAALFGSAIPGVAATGIASRDFGIAIFRDGEEHLHFVGSD